MMELSRNVKVVRLNVAVAAGSTDIETGECDTQGFEGVLLLANVTPASSASSYKFTAQVCASTTGTFASVANSSMEVAAGAVTNTFLMAVDLPKPSQRYVRALVTRTASNTAVGGVWAVLYGPHKHVGGTTAVTALNWSTSGTKLIRVAPFATSS